MGRDEEVEFQQDRLGNERKKLDELRAVEGNVGSDSDDQGLVTVGSADTGSDVLLYSLPGHADRVILSKVQAYNSDVDDTLTVKEVMLDSNGNIDSDSTTQRSVPLFFPANDTNSYDYEGQPITDDAIAVNSEFEGQVGASVVVDIEEASEDLQT